jgi:hypothetical protein
MIRWATFLPLFLGSVTPLGVIADSASADDKALTTTIPRESISGSGYRALRALEPELFIYRDTPEKWKKYSTPEGIKEARALATKSLAYPIELAIGKLRPRKDGQADPGFAVRGEGRDALQGIYNVFVKGAQPSQTFPTGMPISVVFFAPRSIPVRIDRVERTNGKITIRYMLLSDGLPVLPWHLSIIPLGKLPTGEYDVEMLRSHEREKESNPPDFPPVPPNSERGIICQPFSFVVADDLN